MSLEMWSQVKMFSNGENLDAETLNVPIGQLGDRTSYLYNKLKGLMESGKMSAVILTDVPLATKSDREPEEGNAVYLDSDEGCFAVAKATMSLYDDFKAANSAFTVGILQSKEGDKGNVLVYGNMSLNLGGAGFKVDSMIESDEDFRPGRYYLSANEAGKLTANPNGPVIYVCSITGEVDEDSGRFDSGSAIVSPQFLDIGTSHIHRTAVLTARPAGTESTDGYLPIDETFDAETSSGPLAIRFGGIWTSDNDVEYEFWFADDSAYWPTGATLYWSEDGVRDPSMKVVIPAPDVEVPISNGLTAKVTFPDSKGGIAYSELSANKRTWASLSFPNAGKGWLDHEAFTIAEPISEMSGPKPKVAIRGSAGESILGVNVVFPSNLQVATISQIEDGSSFIYGGVTYDFTADIESYSGSNTPLPVGSCLADSIMILVNALSKAVAENKFAMFEDTSVSDGSSAYLVVMDGDPLSVSGIISNVSEVSSSGSRIVEGVDLMVVFDGCWRVIGNTAYVRDIDAYTWTRIGSGIEVMPIQDVSGTIAVANAETPLFAAVVDDEPDALYDYVIGMDQQVARFWPPVPPKSAALLVNGVEMDNKALLPDSPTVSFGKDTIHWFEDDEGRKPWPESFVRRGAYIDPAYDKAEVMHWVRGFQGATGPVTSIQVREGSPLKIYGYGTNDTANTGDLELAADFDFEIENGGVGGYNVPKRARNGKLIAGPVVEQIIGGAGVSVISKAGCPNGQGTVIIALDNGSYRSQFTDIALENAEQAKIGMFPYIRLKGYTNTITSPSAFTATMRVPTNLPDGNYSLKIQASVFGEVGFSDVSSRKQACIRMSYNILPDFDATDSLKYRNLKTGLLKPDEDRTILIPLGHEEDGGIVYNGFDPVLVMTDDSTVKDDDDVVAKVLGKNIPYSREFIMQDITPNLRPGYLVGIRFSRAVASGSEVIPYTDPLGFINLSWTLTAAEGKWRSSVGTNVNPLDGVEVNTTTEEGVRKAVGAIGGVLGARVVKSRRLNTVRQISK